MPERVWERYLSPEDQADIARRKRHNTGGFGQRPGLLPVDEVVGWLRARTGAPVKQLVAAGQRVDVLHPRGQVALGPRLPTVEGAEDLPGA